VAEIELIEGAVYHLLSLRRGIERSSESAKASPAKGEKELLLSIRDGTATSTELTRCCLEFIAPGKPLPSRQVQPIADGRGSLCASS
jgi:hypothetical protein